jgi:phospholipase/carboxylesterase
MVSIDSSLVQWSHPEGERDGRPLVLLLHGVGSHEGDLLGLVPYLSAEFTYASLRAPLPHGPGWSWYPLTTPGAPDYAAVDEGADAVLAWLDAVVETLPEKPTSVGLLGFSQGGSLALQLLRKRPDAFEFAVVLAGFVVPGPGTADAVGGDATAIKAASDIDAAVAAVRPPVFYGRGDVDQVIPGDAVERTETWLAGHTAAESGVYPGLGHGISQEELDDVNGFLARVHPA